MSSFYNLYSHDFARVAVATPRCRIADPAFNAAETIALARRAEGQGAVLVAFPELGLSAYSCDDLFHQRALLDACEQALGTIVEASAGLRITLCVGLPLRVNHQLYNCAAVVCGGRILGIVPKRYLPNYGEFYEARQFSACDGITRQIDLLGQSVPFGGALLFAATDLPNLRFHVEICEDVWVPIPPSSFAALAGATVLVNLSASNALVGKASYRRALVAQQSARCVAAYLYTSAGAGESSTDLAWDGQALIYENGELLRETTRFDDAAQLEFADVDLERLSRERMRQTTFGQSVRRHADEVARFQPVAFACRPRRDEALPLARHVARFPYVPGEAELRNERCREIYNMQVQALAQRLSASAIEKVVVGVSGGLDSTHALLVCVATMDRLGLARTNVLAYTMPGFATGERTLAQARRLMALTGCSAREIDIRPSCIQMLKDLGHPYADGHDQFDVTFENVQAGERTSHLFRLANHNHAIVVGTGDLSELALGWCTYGVGDHMSHYNVNASVPKTLISHLVQWVADGLEEKGDDASVLHDILATEISPELVPGSANGQPVQSTESVIGPYALQDFNLYYVLRYGFAPAKIAFLAMSAWQQGGNAAGGLRYDLPAIKGTLRIFLKRFFGNSQFKRSCVPNSPKIGNGGSLSPRGDWRAPSDAEATVWLADLARIPDEREPAGAGS